MRIDIEYMHSPGTVELIMEGEVHGEEMDMVAKLLVPNCEQLLGLEPQWEDGMTGLMQLIVFIQSVSALQVRR